MLFQFEDGRPLFLQIAEGIEDGILSGIFPEEGQVPSTTEISSSYKINPATVLKGMNLLVEQGLIYKKRGLGLFVQQGAAEKIRKKRKDAFYEDFILSLCREARRLKLGKEELFEMMERGLKENE